MNIVVILLIALLLCGGGGFYAHGAGVSPLYYGGGIGTVIAVLLILFLLGVI